MPCTRIDMTEAVKREQQSALEKLRKALAMGTVTVTIGANGSLSFRGWNEQGRGGMFDLCAYRKLLASNSPELRKAIARAEVQSGRKLNPQAINAGVHSHDGGTTWSKD